MELDSLVSRSWLLDSQTLSKKPQRENTTTNLARATSWPLLIFTRAYILQVMQAYEASKTAVEDQVSNRARSTKARASVTYRQYQGEEDLLLVMNLVDNELSEPYSIFTYRYFLHNWPKLCWLALDKEHCFGTVVCKQDMHGEMLRGYIAMLVVEHEYRGLGVGSELVKQAIRQMAADGADEVVLEAEITNLGALTLYQNLGFIRDKRLFRYYLSGSDAFRLKLLLPLPPERLKQMQDEQVAAEELTKLSLGDAPIPTADVRNQQEHATSATSRPGLISEAATGSSGLDKSLQASILIPQTEVDLAAGKQHGEGSVKGLGNGLHNRERQKKGKRALSRG